MQNGYSREEIVAGLCASQAHVPPKYLYDELGSQLFELITRLPEYYPTRIESALMARHAEDIRDAVGPGAALVDLGAGNCRKARALMPVLAPTRYVAVDTSAEFLDHALDALRCEFPGIAMHAVAADLAQPMDFSALLDGSRRVFFFPGSSIGNLDPDEAAALLSRVHDQSTNGGLLIGVDLVKEAKPLRAAYNDGLGITAAFNLNLLNHLNALLHADFRLADWHHRAIYDERRGRVEMHLDARDDVLVSWPGGRRRFRAGESIHTENSYKYRLGTFQAMLADAGFRDIRAWTDERRWFAVCYGSA